MRMGSDGERLSPGDIRHVTQWQCRAGPGREWRGPTPAAPGATLVSRDIGSGGPGGARAGHSAHSEQQLPTPTSSGQSWESSLAVTPWVWTVSGGDNVVMISITRDQSEWWYEWPVAVLQCSSSTHDTVMSCSGWWWLFCF